MSNCRHESTYEDAIDLGWCVVIRTFCAICGALLSQRTEYKNEKGTFDE